MKNQTHNGFRVRHEGYRQIIQLRTFWLARIFVCLFLTVWLLGWSSGCAMIIFGLVTDFSWFALLFAIPFFIGWFAGAAFFIVSLFGKEQLVLEKDHLELEYLVLVPVKRKRIPYKEILSIELTTLDRFSTIKIESTSKPLSFGAGKRLPVLEELHEYLLDEVPTASGAAESDLVNSPVRLQRRTVKPDSSQWQFEVGDGQRGTTFVNRGVFELGGTLLLLGITLFWNGIVGVFLVKIIQAWRGLEDEPASVVETVFLIPFVLVGTVMLLLLLFTVLEPFRKTVYRFSTREIYREFGYFGISWTKVWPVMHSVTMELETEIEDDPGMSDGMNYLLKFSYRNEKGNDKLMEIREMTLAEVCWVATEIEKRQSSYTWAPSKDDGGGVIRELGQ